MQNRCIVLRESFYHRESICYDGERQWNKKPRNKPTEVRKETKNTALKYKRCGGGKHLATTAAVLKTFESHQLYTVYES